MTESTTPRVITHRTFLDIENELGLKYETAAQITTNARHEVEKLQLQLEAATRELVRLEGIEAAIVRELDACWDARTDYEALELDRHHAEAEESLKAANDRLAELAEEREALLDD